MGNYVGVWILGLALVLVSCSEIRSEVTKENRSEKGCNSSFNYRMFDSLTIVGDVGVCVNNKNDFQEVKIEFPREFLTLRFMKNKKGVYKKTENGFTKLENLKVGDQSLVFSPFENEYHFFPWTKEYRINDKLYKVTSHIENYRGTSIDENRGYYLKNVGLIFLNLVESNRYLKLVESPSVSDISNEDLSALIETLMKDKEFCQPFWSGKLPIPPEPN